jgi:hypothetical protein
LITIGYFLKVGYLSWNSKKLLSEFKTTSGFPFEKLLCMSVSLITSNFLTSASLTVEAGVNGVLAGAVGVGLVGGIITGADTVGRLGGAITVLVEIFASGLL